MRIFAWLQSHISSRYRAMWLYRRGMMRAKLHNNQAAIADYTAVVEMAGIPAEVRAMALYNRALVYHASADEANAVDDLNRVLEMPDVAENIKTEVRRKIVRMNRATSKPLARETPV